MMDEANRTATLDVRDPSQSPGLGEALVTIHETSDLSPSFLAHAQFCLSFHTSLLY
jgi:hypothetical protein